MEPPGPSQVETRVHKVRSTPMGRLSLTEEVIDLDAAKRRWTERTMSGGIAGTEITWQVVPSDAGSTRVVRSSDSDRTHGPSAPLAGTG